MQFSPLPNYRYKEGQAYSIEGQAYGIVSWTTQLQHSSLTVLDNPITGIRKSDCLGQPNYSRTVLDNPITGIRKDKHIHSRTTQLQSWTTQLQSDSLGQPNYRYKEGQAYSILQSDTYSILQDNAITGIRKDKHIKNLLVQIDK
ncbi:hypothetical protein DPMN_103646 [Dreissena polymorpha]|uniref:Uncharacterized protein n=1 Tax=Dreissena polymorpha TaxID=45954 RepID=A0A9D4K2Q5_DREPO|nr:hypothetical protein DPMN_103646 [Dreissena polymorpha]